MKFFNTIIAITATLGVVLLMGCAKPLAQFSVAQGEKVAPVKLKFQNQSKNAEDYIWVFGDGDTSTAEAPYHTFNASGDYEVQLIAQKGSKTNTITQTIEIQEPEKCLVELETELGTMTILLFDATPKHRDNFLKLVEKGYYDGTLFHRVINGFMVQGGDPNSKNAKPNQRLGTGGPDYTVPAEFVDTLIHLKGALAAARQGDGVNPKRASSGSQFYIVQGRPITDDMLDQIEAKGSYRYTADQRAKYKAVGGTPFLDRQYTVFGQVIKGLDVIDKIAAAETAPGDRPVKDIKMTIKVVK